MNKENCLNALSPDMLATDIAYYLVKKGVSQLNVVFLNKSRCCVILTYLIVHYATAFLHSFLLLVTVVKGRGPKKRHLYFYSVVLEFLLCDSISTR